jgi:hypothetical protein
VRTMTTEYLPDYVIKDCGNNGIYKIIKFKRSNSDFIKIDKSEQKSNDNKLFNNICRARSRVLELALCNEWEWFVNLTLDEKKYNRYELKKFAKDLSQWFRDQRKKYGTAFQYLVIPEQHKDGAWHMHGLLNGIPDYEITEFVRGVHPQKLIDSGYKNFKAYAEKFGFISMGKIKDKSKCAFYISKYITKDLTKRLDNLNAHLYYASQGLSQYENVTYINGSVPELDEKLVNHGEFCSTGYVFNEVETFPLRYDEETIIKSSVLENDDISEKEILYIADVITCEDLIKMY